MSACTALPSILERPSPQTLADLLARVEEELAPKIARGATAAYWERNSLRTACRHLAAMLEAIPELLDIERIIELTRDDYMRQIGCTASRASHHVSVQHKLLKYAISYGWTCEAYRRRQAWEPVCNALRTGDDTAGCLGIVTFANRNGVWPATFSQVTVKSWRSRMLEQSRSHATIDLEETTFRRRLRAAGLQGIFPNFSLDSKKPSSYALRLDCMSDMLRREILGIIRWRVHEGNTKSRLRKATERDLFNALLQFCGYATRVLRICGIMSLQQILTEEVVKQFITWLREERKCRWPTVSGFLGRIYALTQLECPPFSNGKRRYAWFGNLLRRLPREPKDELRKRKIARSVTYRQFVQIARKISTELKSQKGLTPVQRARLFRDFFFCSAIACHPWRRRNWSECRIEPGSRPNIFYGTIPRRVQRDGKLPVSINRALKENPEQEFWICHYVEAETKGKNEIWEPLDRNLVDIFIEYCDIHRPLLVGDRPDPGTLLVNNAGNRMTKNQLTRRMAAMSTRHIGKRLGLHIVRDIVAGHALACGCTFERLQSKLWHKHPGSTQRYLSGLTASHGAVALEKHFAALACGRS